MASLWKRIFYLFFFFCDVHHIEKKLFRRPSIALDMEVIKFQLSQQEEKMRKIILSRCFQWVIKEMKCIMMVMPLHVPSAATIFDVLFFPRSFFRAFYSREPLLLTFVRSSLDFGAVFFLNFCLSSTSVELDKKKSSPKNFPESFKSITRSFCLVNIIYLI